jgi:hypothetical protein
MRNYITIITNGFMVHVYENSEATWFEENRETKVNGFKRGIFPFICKQKVLRLQIPVHHSVFMASLQTRFMHIVPFFASK